MKKIILTVTNDLNYDQRMQRICNSLTDAGFDVLLVGRKKKNSLPLAKQPFNQMRLNCLFEKGKLFYLEYNIRLFVFLLFKRLDAVCGIDLDTIIPCLLVSILKNKSCIYDAHEYFPELPEVVNRKFTRSVWKWIERVIVPHVNLRYTVSDGLKEIFEKKYNVPFYVIRNLPVLEDIPAINKNEKIIIYQGALNKGRGLEQTIEAMQKIDAQFWIAGDGDIAHELRSLVLKYKLGDKVKFLGYVLPHDLKLITLQASIGINVLEHIGESYYNSLPNKVFDYIQACVPSVNIDFPEMKKLNNEYYVGLLIEECTTNEISGAINNLLNNIKLYNELRQNCLSARLKLNWQNEEKKLLSIYQTIK